MANLRTNLSKWTITLQILSYFFFSSSFSFSFNARSHAWLYSTYIIVYSYMCMYIVYVYMCKCLLNSYAILFFSFSPLLVIKYILFLFFFFFFFRSSVFSMRLEKTPTWILAGNSNFTSCTIVYICISIQERKIRDKSGGKRIFSRSKILENRNGRYSIYIYI